MRNQPTYVHKVLNAYTHDPTLSEARILLRMNENKSIDTIDHIDKSGVRFNLELDSTWLDVYYRTNCNLCTLI